LSNGESIPVIGYGTWQLSEKYLGSNQEVIRAVKDAIDSGYRHIDTADRYENEKAIGTALEEIFASGKVKRDQLYITTKVWNNQHTEELALKSVRRSLDNLKLDYLDLVLIHWPVSFQSGGDYKPLNANGSVIGADLGKENFELAYKGLERAVQLGLTKSIGVSNFNIAQLERVLMIARIPPVINQVESHPFLAQEELLEFCTRNGVRLEAYSPLRRADPDLLENETLKRIANKYGKTVVQVVLRWQIQRGVVVIPKSSKLKRMRENRDLFDFSLSKGEMHEIGALNRNDRVIKYTDGLHLEEYPF